ncbi:hypothetical protein [Streptomyces canus]|uniref:hypothetical protein n=1 Tax=Streptomyces canus TaxID=58343 RepID=UPI00037F9784|nr:hypothetical protein [Streptomyces canus]
MTDDVLFLLPGQRATPLRDAATGHRAAVPDSAVLGTGTWALARGREVPAGTEEAVADACPVAARTPGPTPVVRGTRPVPGCAVVGGGAFEAGRREADTGVLRRSARVVVDDPATAAEHAGPVGGALRTGLPTGLVGLGDVPTGRAVARAAPGDTVHQHAAEGERR